MGSFDKNLFWSAPIYPLAALDVKVLIFDLPYGLIILRLKVLGALKSYFRTIK